MLSYSKRGEWLRGALLCSALKLSSWLSCDKYFKSAFVTELYNTFQWLETEKMVIKIGDLVGEFTKKFVTRMDGLYNWTGGTLHAYVSVWEAV